MSIHSLLQVLDNSKAKGSHKLVLIEIANACNKTDGLAWVSFTTLSNRSGISRRQVIRLVNDLIANGQLEEHPGKGPRGLTAYRIPTGDMVTPVDTPTGDKFDTPTSDKSRTRLVTNSTTVSCSTNLEKKNLGKWLREDSLAYKIATGEIPPRRQDKDSA